jgi:hypothetical protein
MSLCGVPKEASGSIKDGEIFRHFEILVLSHQTVACN